MRNWSRAAAVVVLLSGCSGRYRPTPVVPASSIEAAPDQFVQLGQATLRYREAGAGEPVVIIHGYSARLEFLAGLGDSLALDHHVIGLDVRGFGASTKFGRESDFGRQMADDIVGLLDRLHIQRAHLVGHSMGALIAANVAARYPDRVASAALLAGPFWPDSAAAVQDVARWGRELDAGRGLTAFLLWILPGMDSAAAWDANRSTMAINDFNSLRAVLPSLGALTVDLNRPPHAPVLIAAAGRDPLNPYSHALATRWPSARLLEVSAANHLSILTQPEVLAAIRQVEQSPLH